MQRFTKEANYIEYSYKNIKKQNFGIRFFLAFVNALNKKFSSITAVMSKW